MVTDIFIVLASLNIPRNYKWKNKHVIKYNCYTSMWYIFKNHMANCHIVVNMVSLKLGIFVTDFTFVKAMYFSEMSI